MSNTNKEVAYKIQQSLLAIGYSVGLNHCYQLLASLAGYNNWNVAKAKNVDLKEVIAQVAPVAEPLPIHATLGQGQDEFEVKVTIESSDVYLKKYYIISASSTEEANTIIQHYLDIRQHGVGPLGHVTEQELEQLVEKYPQIQKLLDLESEEDFINKNWEVIWTDVEPTVQTKSTFNISSLKKSKTKRMCYVAVVDQYSHQKDD